MATRSFISIRKGETYEGVYCHWDGYPEGVGKVLSDHYKDTEKVQSLINGGGMSSIEPNIENIEYYTKRGEQLKISKSPNIQTLKTEAEHHGCEYLYVFENDSWKYFKL